ncbi:MAG: hypothetical protein NDJ92_17755 [Thermoanaerobaculia bacterium]|nr:hypothetical protein [Thermoanaerobaculia bacterium]
MKKTAVTIAIVLLATSTLSAQSSKKGKSSGPAPIDATVSQIHDRRTSSFFSQLDITVQLQGISEADISAARITIRKAVDDTGRDLIDPEASEPQFETTSSAYFKEKDTKTPASVAFKLKNPSRDAVVVKEIRGEVELYMPDKDKDAVVVLPKFQSLAGKPVSNKALKANGIEVSVIGKAQLEAEKKKASKAKADGLKKEGVDDETIKWMVSSFEDSFFVPGEGEIALKVNDPNKRVHEYALLDGAGTPQRVYPRDQDGLIVLSTYGSAVDPSWGLQIKLRTPKTMAHHTFALNDVELP